MFHCAIVGLVCLAFLGPVAAQEPQRPGKEHEKFKEMVGHWDAHMKMEGGESKCTADFKLDMGGFYLVQEFNGDLGGMKFKGRGMTGYCPIRKEYIGIWTDSMSPSPMIMRGKYLDDKTFVEEGEGPSNEGKMVVFKSKSVMKDADTMVFTMATSSGGKDTHMFEITYKRRK